MDEKPKEYSRLSFTAITGYDGLGMYLTSSISRSVRYYASEFNVV